MVIGIPKERKSHEGRVGLDPKHVSLLKCLGREIFVEENAGVLSGFSNKEYVAAGAKIVSRDEVWTGADYIIKVKEPLLEEYRYLKPGLIIMAFFHFAGNPELKKISLEAGIIPVPYESIYIKDGSRPILRAMSLVAGEIAVDVGAYYLRKINLAKGVLLRDAVVTIIGALGVAGFRVYEILRGYGVKKIYALDLFCNPDKIRPEDIYLSTPENIAYAIQRSDLVIGAAAVNPAKNLPKIITRDMIRSMEKFSVFVDIAIDEGGTSETSFVTSHDKPIYLKDGIIHYCVPNMPGIVPRSSAPALIEAAFPFIEDSIRTTKVVII